MRVLHVIPAVADRYGGPSKGIFEMCRAVSVCGDEVTIVATNADGRGVLSVPLGKKCLYKGVTTIFFPRQWSEAFKYSKALAQWVNVSVGKFDCVHIHAVFSHASLAAASACRKASVPYIARPLGSLAPWSLRQKKFRKRLFWYFGVRDMLKGAATIHYTSEIEKRLAQEALGLSGGTVIPLGVDYEALQEPSQTTELFSRYPQLQQGPYLIALSRLHYKKGFELLLEVFFSLVRLQKFRQWKLVIAGEGDDQYTKKLQTIVESHRGANDVIFTGWTGGTLKTALLQNASLFVLPSLQENFGISVVEALASEVPVAISDQVNIFPAIKEVSAGWVFSLDKVSFSNVLSDALENEQERIRRGRRGRQLVKERFSWPAVAARLCELYRSLQNNGTSGQEEG